MSIRENATIPETEQLEREVQGSIAPGIENLYSIIPSNHLSRGMRQISGRRGVTDIVGKKIIKHGNTTITTTGNQTVSVTDWQNLDFIEMMWKETGNGETVQFSLEDYMKRRGFKTEKTARRAIKEGLNRIYDMSISFSRRVIENEKEEYDRVTNLRLIDGTDQEEPRGVYSVSLTPRYLKYLKQHFSGVIHYPLFLLKLSNHAAYQIGRYLSEQKNRARLQSQSNEDFSSVKAILSYCDIFPTPEEIKKIGGYRQRIINPFIKAMDALAPHITWEFSKAKREPLTEEEKKKALTDINFFMTLFVKTNWTDYPDMTETKEKRQKAIEENKKRKEKSKLIAMADIERKKIRTREQAKKQSETV